MLAVLDALPVSNVVGRHRGEDEPALDAIVARDDAARHVDEGRAVEELHLIIRDAVEREGREVADGAGTAETVLQRVDINLVYRLRDVEIDRDGVGIRAARLVVPAA